MSAQVNPIVNPSAKLAHGVPFSAYRAIAAEHSTGLKQMLVSPLHYLHATENDRKTTPALSMGRAVHTSVLEPDRFALEYAICTLPTKGEGSRLARDAWKKANADRTILDEDDYHRALAIRNAVRRNKVARAILEDAKGKPEVTATWRDRMTGLDCKCRFDWLCSQGWADLKTTRRIDMRSFSAEVARLAYNVQFAFYQLGHIAVFGEPAPVWAIVVENVAPHDVVVYRVPDSMLEDGANTAAGLLARVKECREADHWPGVAGDQAHELTLPEWALGSTKSTALELDMGDGASLSF